ncbi:MAG: rhodanese-like domain-containing protein [bacterium]|nr:rhodanese-like domain-containing protein [bacterium]
MFATITKEALKEKLDRGERIQLIDIRSYESYFKERIRGARSLAYEHIYDRIEILDQSKPIILYGEDENDPFVTRTAEVLIERNFDAANISIYTEGLLGWRAASYFTTSGDEPISS